MQKFVKPSAARQSEARSRARQLRVRVEVVIHARHYRAKSQRTDAMYLLDRTVRGWECTCEGYRFTGVCKHLAAVERRSEREGWSFGKIAPRS